MNGVFIMTNKEENRIRKLREAHNLKQNEVAEVIWADASAISYWENHYSKIHRYSGEYDDPGRRILRDYNITRIADYYQVTTDYLLGRTDHPYVTIIPEPENALYTDASGYRVFPLRHVDKWDIGKPDFLEHDASAEMLNLYEVLKERPEIEALLKAAIDSDKERVLMVTLFLRGMLCADANDKLEELKQELDWDGEDDDEEYEYDDDTRLRLVR